MARFMDFIWRKLKELCCTSEHGIIQSLDADLKDTMAEAEQSKARITSLQAENDELKKAARPVPEAIVNKARDIQGSYPAANIVYAGYTIKLKNRNVTPEIRVQDFVHVLPSHRLWCEKRNLLLTTYVENNPDANFGELVNELMMDIYLAWLGSKTYVTDAELYGVDEQWAPALDTWYVRTMDCENSTLELMDLFEAAGLTGILRAFYWNVCGATFSGFGHSTLNAYDFRDDCFRHMETTATVTNLKTFHDLPRWDNAADDSNIKDVWWSFNSETARHTFSTAGAKKSYSKRDRFRNFIIKK